MSAPYGDSNGYNGYNGYNNYAADPINRAPSPYDPINRAPSPYQQQALPTYHNQATSPYQQPGASNSYYDSQPQQYDNAAPIG